MMTQLIEAGVKIPDEVALLCIGNDDLICTTTPVPMTAVEADGFRIGWLAVQQLHSQLEDAFDAPTPAIYCQPKGIVERRSTETVAIADKLVGTAVAIMHAEIGDPPSCSELAERLGVSVRTLETRFRSELSDTPYQYQLALRIQHAKSLLRETRKSNLEIALDSGFRSENRFEQTFKRLTGMRPSQFRTARSQP